MRFGLCSLLVILPIFLLSQGIYGSFLFTFSIPLLWQAGFRKEPVVSLGITQKSLGISLVLGMISGCLLGFLGGQGLKILGLTGISLDPMAQLQWTMGGIDIRFPLGNELGYRLLNRSDTLKGILVYLLFNIFLIGLGEEIFWRGFIQSKLRKYFSKNAAIGLSAFFFALIHFYLFFVIPVKLGVAFLVLIGLGGIIWGYLYEYSKNIWGVAISHGITAFLIWKFYFFAS